MRSRLGMHKTAGIRQQLVAEGSVGTRLVDTGTARPALFGGRSLGRTLRKDCSLLKKKDRAIGKKHLEGFED